MPNNNDKVTLLGLEIPPVDTSKADKALASIKTGITNADKAAQSLNSNLDKTSKGLDKATGKAETFGKKIEVGWGKLDQKIKSTASNLQRLDMEIGKPIQDLIDSYTKYAQLGDPIAESYTRSTKDLTNTVIELKANLGKFAAEGMTDIIKQVNKMLQDVNKFMQENPEAVASVGKILGMTAGVITFASAAMKLTETIVSLMKFIKPIVSLAAKGLAGAGGAVTAGVATGFGVNEYLANQNVKGNIGGVDYGFTNINKYATVIANGLGKMVDEYTTFFGGESNAQQEWTKSIGELTGALEKVDDATITATSNLKDWTGANALYVRYREDQQTADENYAKSIQRVTDSVTESIKKLDESFLEQQKNLSASYTKSLLQAKKDLNTSLADINEAFSKSIKETTKSQKEALQEMRKDFKESQKEAYKDFLDQLEQIDKQHYRNLEGIEGTRDALAIVAENRRWEQEKDDATDAYSKARKEAQENFDKQLKETKEANKKQLAEMRRSHKEQEIQLKENYLQQIEALKENYEEQKAEQKKAYDEQKRALIKNGEDQKAELTKQYNEQYAIRKKAFLEQLALVQGFLENEKEQKRAYYKQMENDLIAWLESMANDMEDITNDPNAENQATNYSNNVGIPPITTGGGTTRLGGRQSGGYVSWAGAYELAEKGKEFVIDTPTTSLLESKLGTLSQSKLLDRIPSSNYNLSQGNRYQNTVSVNVNGGITPIDRMWIINQVEDQVYSILEKVTNQNG